ncbi:11509_t:CDS:2, partial [Scutellospora calospora]
MKITYKPIAQYLLLCLIITLTKSQQSFNYTESTLETQDTPPLIADIKSYDDGTILVHVIRNYSTQLNIDCLMSLEPKLRIRIIHLNRTVKEIDPDLKLDPNNTSILHNIINPISIYPLQKQFILITYINTTNSSELTTYEEWANVIDWNGNSQSVIDYFSYNYSLVTIISTVDNGYIAVSNDTQYNSDLLLPLGGLYTSFIPYNQSHYNPERQIYITQPNITINSVYCDNSCYGVIICIVSVNSKNTLHYLEIELDSVGAVLIMNIIYEHPNVTGLYQQSWSAKIMPFCSYILGPFLTNYFGVNTIMNNNTFLLASPYTNNNTSWSLLTIPLPLPDYINDSGYDNPIIIKTIPPINAVVNSSITTLNITINDTVTLSTGNITIYKASDNSIRQRISATMHEFCNISYDRIYFTSFLSITVIKSTFNEYGEQYFVTMDNNFVMDTNAPLKGIHDGIWILKSDEAITGSVHLTVDASKKFLNQSAYFYPLLNELSVKVPINRSRLSSNNRFYKVLNDQIVILI